jgi:pimeloyl-ACP methyl ester carboxylesterase
MDDLDDVRAWLGYDRINLYGTSYGTWAAQEYLRRHPHRVRSALLKAVVAPSRDWGVFWARNTEQALEHLFKACAADTACHQAYPNPRGDLATTLERLGKGPVPVEVATPDGSKVQVSLSRSAAVAALRAALAAPTTAVGLPLLLRQAASGDLSGLATAALQYRRAVGPELSEGMFFTVMCAEVAAGLDAKALARESVGTLFGEEPMRELMAACAEWPRPPRPRDFGRAPKVETPVLLISGRLDPSTPPENGEALARDLRGARHLVVPYGSHSFNNLGGCVDEIIAAFVTRGSAAGLDTSCAERIALPPFALPRPGSAPAQ